MAYSSFSKGSFPGAPDRTSPPAVPPGPGINAGASKLEPPKIRPVTSRRTEIDRAGAITEWETPYNRPAYSPPEKTNYSLLAGQYLQQGRVREAEALYRTAYEVARTTGGDPDDSHAGEHSDDLVRSIEDLAWFYFSRDQFLEAEPFVSELVEIRARSLSAGDELFLRSVDELAAIYEKTGRARDAISLYKFLLARQEDVFGRNSLIVPATLARLASCYMRQGHYEAAETVLHRILSIQEPVYGRSSIEISKTLEELADTYIKQQIFDKAAEMLERRLHILESIHGENGVAVASCLLKLADLLAQLGMRGEAEPLYRRVVAIYQKSYGRTTAEISVNRKKLVNMSERMPKRSRDKPEDQEACGRWPVMTPELLGLGKSGKLGAFTAKASSQDNENGDHEQDREIPAVVQARLTLSLGHGA